MKRAKLAQLGLVLALLIVATRLVLPDAPETATPPAASDVPPAGGVVDLGLPFGPPAPDRAPPEPVRFLVWGDAGHGNPAQYAVADAAAATCAAVGCDFVLQLGDNVYYSGVSGPDDPRFVDKFERPYANLTLPFYVVLGNHDVAVRYPNGSDNGDHQVAYTYRSDRVSSKWTMPARHYAFAQGPAAFFALDLTRAAEASELSAEDRAQLAWLRNVTSASEATWRIAFSHYPYDANGRYGAAGAYGGVEGRGLALKTFLEEGVCGVADVYLAAHEHILEWLAPHPGCPGTELVVSGAASDPRPLAGDRVASWFSAGGTLGFFWIELSEDRLTGRVYDVEGRLLFERVVERSAPASP